MSEVCVGPRSKLAEGTRLLVEVDGIEIGVLEHNGRLHAYENRCAHQGGPVCEGVLLGKVEATIDADGCVGGGRFLEDEMHLICPWHGWEFDLATGRSVAYPEATLQRFPIIERDGKVYVDV